MEAFLVVDLFSLILACTLAPVLAFLVLGCSEKKKSPASTITKPMKTARTSTEYGGITKKSSMDQKSNQSIDNGEEKPAMPNKDLYAPAKTTQSDQPASAGQKIYQPAPAVRSNVPAPPKIYAPACRGDLDGGKEAPVDAKKPAAEKNIYENPVEDGANKSVVKSAKKD